MNFGHLLVALWTVPRGPENPIVFLDPDTGENESTTDGEANRSAHMIAELDLAMDRVTHVCGRVTLVRGGTIAQVARIAIEEFSKVPACKDCGRLMDEGADDDG